MNHDQLQELGKWVWAQILFIPITLFVLISAFFFGFFVMRFEQQTSSTNAMIYAFLSIATLFSAALAALLFYDKDMEADKHASIIANTKNITVNRLAGINCAGRDAENIHDHKPREAVAVCHHCGRFVCQRCGWLIKDSRLKVPLPPKKKYRTQPEFEEEEAYHCEPCLYTYHKDSPALLAPRTILLARRLRRAISDFT